MTRLIKEPLLHFFLAGAILFAAYAVINGEASKPETAPQKLYVTSSDVNWLVETWTRQWRRPPTPDELRGLVSDYVNEKLLATEAKAIRLDEDDIVIRRRLAQKLTFIIDDTLNRAEPSEDELQRFYEAHRDRFRGEARISLLHIFFNPERRDDASSDAMNTLRTLVAEPGNMSVNDLGDRTLLASEFNSETELSLSGVFGPEFARVVFSLEQGAWSGPIRSEYGLHLVRVSERQDPELRPLAEIRDRVLEGWRRDQETRAKQKYLATLREKYDVVIEGDVTTLLPAATEGRGLSQ